MKPSLANLLWTLGNVPHRARYAAARRATRETQLRILRRFLRRNAGSEYGRSFGYARIESVEAFQGQVPVVRPGDLAPWIDRAARGEPAILTTEPVIHFERTSGSSGTSRLVPYTASFLREVARGVGAWLYDLFAGDSALLGGPQYWALSPLARAPERTPGGIPIGLVDDCEYFPRWTRGLLRRAMAVPSSVVRLPSVEACLEATARRLALLPELRFISVWSPSFLLLLLERLGAGATPRELWPRLRAVSCWTEGPAARYVPELVERFPGVLIQGKGLLATEGVVTIPFRGAPAPAPAITSHFLELLEAGGRPRLVDEVEVGGRYSVVITTGSGLARYELGDEVEVVAPGALRFAGRIDQRSDLCGEKLDERLVESVVNGVVSRLGLSPFAVLVPENGPPPRYVLVAESPQVEQAARLVEAGLRASYHYNYCRELGQLGPVEGLAITRGEERLARGLERLGGRVGTMKPARLRKEPGWRERFLQHAS